MKDRPLTFDPAFGRLGREIARFANHTRRFLSASHRHRLVLEQASAWSEGAAPLAERPTDPGAAMRAIDRFARVRSWDRQTLLGAYFAHHHLRMQAEISRDLLRASFRSDPSRRPLVCHTIVDRADRERREWVAALLELSISAAAPDLSRHEYAAFNVGALMDHEDVDLAIVVLTAEARAALSRSFATVSKTFLRFASRIQLFLSEQLSTPRTGGLIEEYEQLLHRSPSSVVSVIQLLGAQLLCGSPTLARLLEERVTSRYYAGQGSPLVHEGFLRAVLGELRHYLIPDTLAGVLAPKREVYLPAKLAIAAMRVIHGVHEARPTRALKILCEKDPAHAETYATLADAFAQNEVLRALMFLYVMRSDDADLSDPTILAASRRVARLLGLSGSARWKADERLIGAYSEIRARALTSVSTISHEIDLHLGRVSTFRKLVERGKTFQSSDLNLVVGLLSALEQFKGGVFWDEVIDFIGSDRDTAERFVSDLDLLEEGRREEIADRYVLMMLKDSASLVEFLVFLATMERARAARTSGVGGSAGVPPGANAMMFWDSMMRLLSNSVARTEDFVARLDAETRSEELFRLGNAYSAGCLAALSDLIEEANDSPRSVRVVRAIRAVIILVHHSSNGIERTTKRVLGRTPEFIRRLGDTRRLKDLAGRLLAQAARESSPREQIEVLGDAFDVAMLRAALSTLLDPISTALDSEFTQAVDVYVRELFKACFWQVHEQSPLFERYRPASGIAVFATGAYGREEAFGSDWDYIAAIGDEDKGLKKFYGKVLQRLTGAMSRRGLLPHNRFSARFNSYVVSIPEFVDHLSHRSEETFIDEAEILEARFFLGDPAVVRQFNNDVLGRCVRQNRHAFLHDILRELRDRRTTPPMGLDLKRGAGGLRELHLARLAIRMFSGVPGPLVLENEAAVSFALPRHDREIHAIARATTELRRVRDFYRLTVAVDGPMEPELLVRIAEHLRPLRTAGVRADFPRMLSTLMQSTALEIDSIADAIKQSAQ